MSEAQIRVGIGGWTYAPWRGVFYPDKHPQSKELEYASHQLGVIEINATFYGRQKPKSWETWEKVVPDGFQFAIKGSRYCVSRSKLAESADSIANFFGQGFEVLGPKLGPILWQFAHFKRFDRDDIAAFIDLLPETLGGIKLRHAIEPRHKSFGDEQFFALCRERNVAVVLDDSDDYPAIEADTADFAYARLQRMTEEIQAGYDEAALDGFAKHSAMAEPDQPIRISLFAPNGRMGQAIAAAVEQDSGFVVDRDHGDVLVDFSAPAALEASLDRALSAGIPILIGTTGLDELDQPRIAEAAKRIAVLQAANTSLGVALLAELVERAAGILGPEWDVEIAEVHHRMKTDAPSGTALMLGQAAARGRGAPLKAERGRDGTGLKRESGAVGFASLRGGTVAGDHDVLFLGPDERLILSHRAENRMIFARGALAAARFLVGKAAGLYSMRDVVGDL